MGRDRYRGNAVSLVPARGLGAEGAHKRDLSTPVAHGVVLARHDYVAKIGGVHPKESELASSEALSWWGQGLGAVQISFTSPRPQLRHVGSPVKFNTNLRREYGGRSGARAALATSYTQRAAPTASTNACSNH